MSKIDFTFATFPHYFNKHGWLDPKPDGSHMKMITLLVWIFMRCSSDSRKVFHDHKEIELAPYEFIFGRAKCSEQTGLGEQEVRSRLFWLLEAKILEKSTSKSTSKFSVYKILTESFLEITNQQTNQQPTSNQPATNHNKEDKKTRRKEKEKEKKEVADAPSLSPLFKKENVTMKQEFYDKLVARRGKKAVDNKIEYLIDRKNNGHKSRCDYSTLNTWFRRDDDKKEASEQSLSKTVPFQEHSVAPGLCENAARARDEREKERISSMENQFNNQEQENL